MKLMKPAFCLILAAAAATSFAQDAPRETKVFDLERLARPSLDLGWIPAAAPLSARLGGATLGVGDRELSAWIDVDYLVQAAYEAAGPDVDLNVEGTRLWATGSPEAIARTAAFVSAVRAAFPDDVRVRVVLADVAPEKTWMSPAEATAFFASATLRHDASTNVKGATGSMLRSGREFTFVSSYSVEVASKVSIADPVVSLVPTGLTARVSAGGLPDGKILLRVGGVYSRVTSVKDVPAGAASMFGDVQRPEVASSAVSGAAVIESGGAFVLGGGPGGYWVAQATRSVRPGAQDGHVVDCSGLTSGGGALPPDHVPPAYETEGPGGKSGDTYVAEPPLSSDRLIEMLRERVSSDDEESSVNLTHGGGLLIRGGATFRNKVRDAAVALAAASLAPMRIEARFGAVDAATAAALSAGGGPVDRLQGHAVAFALSGERFRVLDGVETTTFADGSVEIAQDASVTCPEVRTTFTGVVFEGAGSIDEEGTGSIQAKFLRRAAPEGPGPAPRLPNSVALETQRFVEIRLEGSVVSRGDWVCLGTATAHDGVFVVMARVAR